MIILALIKDGVIVNRVNAEDESFGEIAIRDGMCDQFVVDADANLFIGEKYP